MVDTHEQTTIPSSPEEVLLKELEPHILFASTSWFQNSDSPHYVSRVDGELKRNRATNIVDKLPASTTTKLLGRRDQVINQDLAFQKFRQVFTDQDLGVPHIDIVNKNVLFVACFSGINNQRENFNLIAAGPVGFDSINIVGYVNFNVVVDNKDARDRLAKKLAESPNATLAAIAKLVGIDYEDENHSLAREKTGVIKVVARELLKDGSVVSISAN